MKWRLLLLLISALLCAGVAPPPDLDTRATLEQKLGASLPLQATLLDQADTSRSLAERLHEHPALIALGYFRCRHLCDTVLQSLAHALAATGLHPGRDVEVIFVSIDPQENRADALQAMQRVERSDAAAGAARWQFLRGSPQVLDQLSQALGFRYYRDERLQQYVHPAGVIVLTPQGKVAQYLFGVEYQPQSLRLAVIDASRGRLGSLTERLVLLCCGYDPSTGRYTPLLSKIMQVLGVVFVLVLAALFARLGWRRRA